MRILYVTNYQGQSVVAQRHHRRNRTLGPSRKVELFASGFAAGGHCVHIVSPATVSEGTCRVYRGYEEIRDPSCGDATVSYLRGIDIPRLNLLFASWQLRRFMAGTPRPDVVFLYNLEWYFLVPTLAYARSMQCPLVIEYEDDALTLIGARLRGWHLRRGRKAIAAARRFASGVVAVSPDLSAQLGIENSVVVPGIVGEDLLAIPRQSVPSEGVLRLVYSGGVTRPKGPDLLVQAVNRLTFPVEVDIVGAGAELDAVRCLAGRARWPVRVHGEVSRETLARVLASAHLAVNPHRYEPGQVGQVFPFKMVEYIGAGLPIVTSRLGQFSPPTTESIVTYDRDDPDCLAHAIVSARERLTALRRAAVVARGWVRSEFSAVAAAQKGEQVLRTAMGRGGRMSASCGC